MKRVRKKAQSMTATRKRTETNVIAYNPALKTTVKFMEIGVLLAHTHPLDRKDFARGFKEEGVLSIDLQKEYGFI